MDNGVNGKLLAQIIKSTMGSADTTVTFESALKVLRHLRAMHILHDCVDLPFETYTHDIANETGDELQSILNALEVLAPLELVHRNEMGACWINDQMLHHYTVNNLANEFRVSDDTNSNATLESYFASARDGAVA